MRPGWALLTMAMLTMALLTKALLTMAEDDAVGVRPFGRRLDLL